MSATAIPSIRLTNYDRDNVAASAITAAFKAREAALEIEADRLGRLCYEAVFSAAARKAAKAMPKDWLRMDACLGFNVGGMSIKLNLLDEGVPVPYTRGGYCNNRLGVVTEPDLVQAVTTYLSDVETLKSDREKARSSLKGLLYSVSTLKALRETWPEGEPFFQGLTRKSGAPGLPAPQITELNAMLGLEKAA